MRTKRGSSPGTKAFFFSDLRDYTAFVETHGDAEAAKLLTEYRTLVRREVARYQGAEIKTEGDSFYVVFDAASTALECAIAILKRGKARADGRLRIGIGLHAGESVAFDDQFVGSAVVDRAQFDDHQSTNPRRQLEHGLLAHTLALQRTTDR